MKEQEIFRDHSSPWLNHGEQKLMTYAQFQNALKERDEYRTCGNCKHLETPKDKSIVFFSCKHPSEIVDNLIETEETKTFGCNQFEDKQ